MCAREVGPQLLLHSCSRHLSGLSRFGLRLSTIAEKIGGCPRTVPPIKEVPEESQTHTHTHTQHTGYLDAELRRGLLQEETSKNHRPTYVQIHLLNHHIPSNLPNSPNPNFLDLLLSLHLVQPRVQCRGPRPKAPWYMHWTFLNCGISKLLPQKNKR